MAKFFLSYRAATAVAHTGRLYDRLAARFGHDSIFFDRGKFGPGTRWEKKLVEELAEAAAVVAIIDPGWVESFNLRRENQYFVRFEIENAIRLGKRIFPVLVAQCPLPGDSELPVTIRPILAYQAVRVDDSNSALYDAAIGLLVASLESCIDARTELDTIVRCLTRGQYGESRRLLEDLPPSAFRQAKVCCYLAVARLEGRSFNGLHSGERESIEKLLRQAHRVCPSWGLPAVLLAVLEIDYYQLGGCKSRNPIRPADVSRILQKEPLSETDRQLLAVCLISRHSRIGIPQLSFLEGKKK
jgi:hypothetical protein